MLIGRERVVTRSSPFMCDTWFDITCTAGEGSTTSPSYPFRRKYWRIRIEFRFRNWLQETGNTETLIQNDFCILL